MLPQHLVSSGRGSVLRMGKEDSRLSKVEGQLWT